MKKLMTIIAVLFISRLAFAGNFTYAKVSGDSLAPSYACLYFTLATDRAPQEFSNEVATAITNYDSQTISGDGISASNDLGIIYVPAGTYEVYFGVSCTANGDPSRYTLGVNNTPDMRIGVYMSGLSSAGAEGIITVTNSLNEISAMRSGDTLDAAGDLFIISGQLLVKRLY